MRTMRFSWRSIFPFVGLAAISAGIFAATVRAADWPQFRGPDGQGHSAERGLPVAWSETENIAWKTPLEGLGWSSPVVCGRVIWLTTAIEEQGSLRAVCLDARTGQILRDVEVFRKDDLGPINSKNSHASPTPVIDGDRVLVHFGDHGIACLSLRGGVLWRNAQLRYEHQHGPAASPVVWRDLVIVACDGADKQYVAALDSRTGKLRWRTERKGRVAYCTPLVVTVDGVDQVVCPGGDLIAAYAPATGEEIWSFRHNGYAAVPRPVFGHGLLYVCSGYSSTALYALRAGGTGDITESHVAWTLRRGAPHDPSPLLVGDELYLVSDLGVASCLDAKTGKPHWQQRFKGGFSASPLGAEGRIYFTNEEGLTTVIAAGKALKKLAENQIEGRTMASLATADQAIFLRTDRALYRIGQAAAPGANRQAVARGPQETTRQ